MNATLVVAVLLVTATVLEARAEPTGSALPGLGSYDEFMAALIRKWEVAGAGLAVARGDKLVLVRGYGLANKDKSAPVEPTSYGLERNRTQIEMFAAEAFRLGLTSRQVTADEYFADYLRGG